MNYDEKKIRETRQRVPQPTVPQPGEGGERAEDSKEGFVFCFLNWFWGSGPGPGSKRQDFGADIYHNFVFTNEVDVCHHLIFSFFEKEQKWR